MLRRKLAVLALVPFLALGACSSGKEKPVPDTGTLTDLNLPEWVLSPEVEDGIAAVGIAQASRGGIQYQIPRAEVDAKGKIAAKVQSEVSQVTKRALRESNTNGINDVEEFFSQATKDVVKNMPLSGVERTDIYRDQDGVLYVRMVLKNKDYSQYMQNSRKMYEQRLQDAKMGRENINKTQKAVDSLFEELEKERNN